MEPGHPDCVITNIVKNVKNVLSYLPVTCVNGIVGTKKIKCKKSKH